jgi:hypothetical protein
MKIVKSIKGFKHVFDTNKVSSIEEYTESITGLEPLHHTSDMTDYEYLKQFFPEDHSIFLDFGDSFYWGKNSLFEMIDFCNRNQLKSRQRTLTLLLNLTMWH